MASNVLTRSLFTEEDWPTAIFRAISRFTVPTSPKSRKVNTTWREVNRPTRPYASVPRRCMKIGTATMLKPADQARPARFARTFPFNEEELDRLFIGFWNGGGAFLGYDLCVVLILQPAAGFPPSYYNT